VLMFSEPYFHNEDSAYGFFERQLWPGGPVCPHCRCTGEKVGRLKGKTTRRGVYKCYACRRPFTVKIGTAFESSHVKLHLWLQAIYLLSCSKKKITVRQLQKTLGIALKTAWVLNYRIREMITRAEGQLAEIGEHRSAGAAEQPTIANAMGATDRAKAAVMLVAADRGAPLELARQVSSLGPKPAHRKRRVRRRKTEHNPKQLTLF
jgi:transposase-like protein